MEQGRKLGTYKTFEELTQEDKDTVRQRMTYNGYFTLTSWTDAALQAEFERIWKEHGNYYRCLNEAMKSVVDDVDAFVKSYNYQDCDGQIDYFHVDFYYFGCCENNGKNIKIVPKTARIKNAENKPAKTGKTTENVTLEIKEKAGYTYKISKGEDTRDSSELWIVRINESLDKAAYIAENKAMRERGGYYSKFLHGFIFRFNPEKILVN